MMETFLAVVCALTAGAPMAPASCDDPPPPFPTYVLAESDELEKTAASLATRLRDRKKWFRIVEEEEEASVVVRVVQLRWERYMGSTYSPDPTPEDRMGVRPELHEVVQIDVEVVFDEEPAVLVRALGPRPKDALFRISRQIERLLDPIRPQRR